MIKISKHLHVYDLKLLFDNSELHVFARYSKNNPI